MIRRRLFALFGLALLASAPLAAWSPQANYTPEAFRAAAAAERVIVLDFHAGWCPTCRAQESALAELGEEEALREVALLIVDFDSAADLKKQYGVVTQSTLIVLRGERELARAIGITSKEAIRALIAKAL